MRIYVCVKHVPDTAATITILDKNRFDDRITCIMNPYDEHAVQAAMDLKKEVDQTEVIAVTLGTEAAENTLRSALAMGADRGIFIHSDDYTDSMFTASALMAAISQDGIADIIFTGREAIDSEGGQTMYRLAAAFGMPAASNVSMLQIAEKSVRVECDFETGCRQVVEMPLPCVIGTGKGLNVPRYPTLPAILKARKKEIVRKEIGDLSLVRPNRHVDILEFEYMVETRSPKELKGNPGEVADALVRILREEAKVI